MARLDVLLARNLGWSRAAARAAIDDGVISIDGAPVTETRVDIDAARLPLKATVSLSEARIGPQNVLVVRQ